ncbi:MAG: aspartyl/glutamyl-tRNA amidotransferase subunit A, partial [Bdellovibrionales bacterium]|nr:aspartyl/glutamyl-tRNA amidotransferase subunit A [Bdellovibrionales bacterium]
LATAALGTDTGGSIRQPGAFCSVTGLKPTYGRISRYGIVAFASSLDQVGTMTHTAEDAALLCSLLFGKDPLDATSMEKEVPAFDFSNAKNLQGKVIGIPKEYFTDALHPEIGQSVALAMKEFEKLGATLQDISLPHTPLAVPAYYIIAPAEASSNLARFDGIRYGRRSAKAQGLKDLYAQSRTEGFGKEVKRRILTGAYVLSSGYYDAYYAQALKVRRLIQQDFTSVFEQNCDFILSPTTPTTAFRKGEKFDDPIAMYLNDIYTVTVNLAGLPAINLPCGFDAEGLPIGLQLIGKPWSEELLLEASTLYQRETDWHAQRPSLEEAH